MEKSYFEELKQKFNEAFSIAESARKKGIDPTLEPEPIVTADIAERVEKSVGPIGIAERVRELKKTMSREEIAFKIVEEIIYGKYKLNFSDVAEQAIRTALAILDEGVTVAPIQGISSIKIKENPDKTKHLAIYFAGPIRSAGGTEMGLIFVIADFVRKLLGLDRYRATELEAKRFIEEIRVYEREVSRFQFKIPDEEIFNVIMKLPVEVNGVETDPVEITSFRDLPRIETNRVRGGALRAINDGLIGRANKVLKIVEKLRIEGWEWLRSIIKFEPSLNNDVINEKELMYMKDVVAGRPIFSFPMKSGGFRLRYGRSRNTGLAAIGIHPATMAILKDFIVSGTQLRIEKPGKAGIVVPVDSIEPPIVKLKDGSVLKVISYENGKKIIESIDSILFLGDIIIGFGEFLENDRDLEPPGFVEEWWSNILQDSLIKKFKSIELASLSLEIDQSRLKSFIENPLIVKPSFEEAIKLSLKLEIPLHPSFTYFWENISLEDFKKLRKTLILAEKKHHESKDKDLISLILSLDQEFKEILEKLCLPHKLIKDKIIIENDEAKTLLACLSLDKDESLFNNVKSVFEAIKKLSGIIIYEKGGTFIGARMGRPEKANRREMKPIVHCLFPVGLFGGARRNIVEAASKEVIPIEIVRRRCLNCNNLTFMNFCEICNSETVLEYVCKSCGRIGNEEVCQACKCKAYPYDIRGIRIKEFYERSLEKLKLSSFPDLVKGVKGLTSKSKTPELIEKGILRAKYGLSVFKDGTIRFDSTNAPLTHFKPLEIGVSTEKLKELGYKHDYKGNLLTSPSQLCSLNIQDIIIPEKCAEYFVKVANFIDELLQKLYGLSPYYKAKSKEDLIGHLVIGLSPHTSVGIIGRIIGFTKANVCFAHPIWHAAKRRDADGDEDSLALVLDVLINFSKEFLPEKIGGIMDAPLLLTLEVKPYEVARQAFNIETIERFPLDFFEKARMKENPKKLYELIETIQHRLGTERQYDLIGFTHFTSDINSGNHESSYKKLKSMFEKVKEQLDLAKKIKAVNAKEVALKVVSTHLMRDLSGNLKAFSTQKFRCMKCNLKYRRIPLKGVCLNCGGKLALTVHKGSIEKYLDLAEELVENFEISEYFKQRLDIIRMEINSLFAQKPQEKQLGLIEFME
ncbi:MAG: DNA polymerase II large subunit [Candidatus Bathyarchaeia archaeon]